MAPLYHVNYAVISGFLGAEPRVIPLEDRGEEKDRKMVVFDVAHPTGTPRPVWQGVSCFKEVAAQVERAKYQKGDLLLVQGFLTSSNRAKVRYSNIAAMSVTYLRGHREKALPEKQVAGVLPWNEVEELLELAEKT